MSSDCRHQVVGGAIAGLSGGLLVGFINLWDPQAWGYAETIVLFAAIIVLIFGPGRFSIDWRNVGTPAFLCFTGTAADIAILCGQPI